MDVRVPVRHLEFGECFAHVRFKFSDCDFVLIREFSFRRVRTLYACMAENDGELSFEPNQIITNGKYDTENVNSRCI